MASYFPKALVYREWREGRFIYVLAALATMLPGVLAILGYLAIPAVSPHGVTASLREQMVQTYWHNFNLDTMQISNHYLGAIVYIVIWVLIPAARLVPERSRGTLDTLLIGPVDRASWMRVKFTYGFLALLIGSIGEWILLWGLHFQAPANASATTAMLVREVGIHWVVYLCFFALGFFVALCVTNTAGAVLVCLGVSMFPYFSGTILGEIFPNSIVQHVSYQGSITYTTLQAPAGSWDYYVQWISPMAMNVNSVGFTWKNPFLYVYLVLTVVAYIGARAYFRRLPAERFQHKLTHPAFWYWMLAGASLLVGSFIGDMVANTMTIGHGIPGSQAAVDYRARMFTVAFIVVTAVVWFVFYRVVKSRLAYPVQRDGVRRRRATQGTPNT